jgi:hypothetical protein
MKAFDHYDEYTRAVQREDTECREAAEYFREIERMGPGREEGTLAAKKKRPGVGLGLLSKAAGSLEAEP